MNIGVEVAKILSLRAVDSDKEFCENIIKQGWCSKKQETILLKINSKLVSKQRSNNGYGYYEECYEENTNSYY